MSAAQFLQYLTQALYVIIFLATAVEAVRRPTRAQIDIALFFGVTALVIAQSWTVRALGLDAGRLLTALTSSLLMALPYLLLRLVNDFSTVWPPLMRAAEAGLALSVISLFAFAPPLPAVLVLLLTFYFFGINIAAAVAFLREARRSTGVTRRRMQAVAAGSGFLGLTILLAGLLGAARAMAAPVWVAQLLQLLQPVCTVASGLGYFLGFAPPPLLRRAWQEPELRAFLGRAASLPRLPDTAAIVRELERGAAASVGVRDAAIGLWDEPARTLRFERDGRRVEIAPGEMIAGRAFAAERVVFSADAARDDPAHAERYREEGASAVLAAPITTGDRRLGVLVIYAARPPLFVREDLHLVRLLSDQAAVILESRALIDEAARVRAREEATRLKDDFLSAAAHDLKTPLTTLVATAELLERRVARNPAAPPDPGAIRRLVSESKRLRTLVLELLDASRVEQRQIVGAREAVDLVALAGEICGREPSDRHCFVLDAAGPIVGEWDAARLRQLVENLVENAVKYSPDGGEVRVTVGQEGGEAHLTVIDRGIGIPVADLPHIFERFQRGTNVDDRRFAGMGLGLYICRGIVEGHGGRVEVSSTPGQGSAFRVTLPLSTGTGGGGADIAPAAAVSTAGAINHA